MVSKKPSAKSTKAEILAAYDELAKEKSTIKSQFDQLAKEKSSLVREKIAVVESKMNQSLTVQPQMNLTIEDLEKIQQGFGSAVSDLSEQLTREASKLQEIRRCVATELEQLQILHNLQVVDETLDNLIEAYEDSSKTFDQTFSKTKENREQEVLTQEKAWVKEQEEHKTLIKERNETQSKIRQREGAEYKYDLELQRKINADEYEQTQKTLYDRLEEQRQEQEKQWAQREKAIAQQEKEFAAAKAKVEALPKEKETALKKATEEGKGIAHYQAKVKADLYNKEVEGQKRFYEQRIQSLEQTIQNQEVRIQNQAKQLESALKQVQDLAVKAIEGAANVNSYQAVKEIALEQAKNQLKNK